MGSVNPDSKTNPTQDLGAVNDIKAQKIRELLASFELETVEQLQRYRDYLTTGQIRYLEYGYSKGEQGVSLYTDYIALPMRDSKLDIISMALLPPDDKQPSYEPYLYATGAYVLGQPSNDCDVYVVIDLEAGHVLHKAYPDAVILVTMTEANLPFVVKSWQGKGLIVPVACHLVSDISKLLTEYTHTLYSLACELDNCMEVEQVHTMLENADKQRNKGTRDRIPKGHIAPPFEYGNGRYEVRTDGVYFVEVDKDQNIHSQRISGLIEVVAKTRNSSSDAWGRLLRWQDDDGKTHIYALPSNMMQSDGLEARQILADGGLFIAPNGKYRTLFATYLQTYPTKKKALCVDKLGWHDGVYVLPSQTLGNQDNEMTVFQNEANTFPALTSKGSLEEWQTHVSGLAVGQSRIVFAISCAFAGQLLDMTNTQGGGFHYYGTTSEGKSTAQHVACSVWGFYENYKRSWRATDNALEGTALIHNDGFLVLDEMGECDTKTLGKTIYMLANGMGKGRMSRKASNKPVNTWRLVFLSSGEVTAKQVITDAGQSVRGGQEIRLVQIEAKASQYGVFDSLTFGRSGASQSDKLKEGFSRYYGTAGMMWLEYITKDKAAIKQQANQSTDDFMMGLPSSVGTVKRVAQRFALVATAGELATQAGITGWSAGEATKQAKRLLREWALSFGSGNIEHKNILAQVKAFFDAHGASRFQHVQMQDQSKVINRAGYVHITHGEKYFYVFDSAFTEICKPFSTKEAIKALSDAGWLFKNDDRNKCKPPKLIADIHGKGRLLAIKHQAMNADTGSSQTQADKKAWDSWENGVSPHLSRDTEIPSDWETVGKVGISLNNQQQIPTIPTNSQAVGNAEKPVNKGATPKSHNSRSKNPCQGLDSGHDLPAPRKINGVVTV